MDPANHITQNHTTLEHKNLLSRFGYYPYLLKGCHIEPVKKSVQRKGII